MIFYIDGETPAKKNSRIINTKTAKCFPSKRFSKWHRSASNIVQYQILRQPPKEELPINQEVKISMTFVHGDLRRRDSDNGTSSILDLLTDCGVLADDNWKIVRELNVKNDYEKGRPCCKVEIELL